MPTIRQRLSNAVKALSAKNINLNPDRALGHGIVGSGFASSPKDKGDYFDNIYDNAVNVANAFAKVEVFEKDDKGDRVTDSHINKILGTPNTSMNSGHQFKFMMALLAQTHDSYAILVHTKNGQAPNKTDQITGLEILDNPSVTKDLNTGKLVYKLKQGGPFTSDVVMNMATILNPYNMTEGYCPATASVKWSRLDDLIADYQKGLFGAKTPPGMFVITAASTNDYESIRSAIKASMYGNSGEDNVLFSHRPADKDTGNDAGSPTIEYIPFKIANKDMALKDLFDNNTKKQNSYFGVPGVIRGDVEATTYASAKVTRSIFHEYTVEPLLMMQWSKFTAELSRILGGFDSTIGFDLPELSDPEERLRLAEAQRTQVESFVALKQLGYSDTGIIAALEFPETWSNLGELKPVDEEEDPETQDSEEAENTPDSVQNKEVAVKAVPKDSIKVRPLKTTTSEETYQQKLLDIGTQFVQKQLQRAANNINTIMDKKLGASKKKFVYIDDNGDEVFVPDEQIYRLEEDDNLLAGEMLLVIAGLVYLHGNRQQTAAAKILAKAGIDTTTLRTYNLGDQRLARSIQEYLAIPNKSTLDAFQNALESSNSNFIKDYRTYLQGVAKSYNADTANSIRNLLEKAIADNIAKDDLVKQLTTFDIKDWQAVRLAESEYHLAIGRSQIADMDYLAEQLGLSWDKTFTAWSGACEFCQAMDGTIADPHDSFFGFGDTITGVDGGTMTNNWQSVEPAHLHPHCQCSMANTFYRY